MLFRFLACCRAAWRFRGYRPQPVTITAALRWINQFESRQDRRVIAKLLDRVVFVTEAEVESALIQLNQAFLERMAFAGIGPQNIIYVQHDDAGSSSPVMLNKLRDGAKLEHAGCTLLDSRDVVGLSTTTTKLQSGAIVYVDEFAGSGDQFVKSLQFARQYIVGNFSEFLLAHTICEEAMLQLGREGIEPYARLVHSRADRPLHDNSNILGPETRERMKKLCERSVAHYHLGYRSLATMVVFYNNAPDTVPRIFRGSDNQTPMCGILPRTTDLPAN